MIRILLIRHGSTDMLGHVLYGRMPGVHLNAEGKRQAALLAEQVTGRLKLASIISSPLERAVETAKPLAHAQAKPVAIDEGITEIDFGEWVGKSFDELGGLQEWKDFNRMRSFSRPPAGESMMEVQARAWRTIYRLVGAAEPGSTVALVTHGDVIRCVLLLILGISIDHIHRLEISPASISEVVVGEHAPLVRHVNQPLQ